MINGFDKNPKRNKSLAFVLLVSLLAGLFCPFLSLPGKGTAAETELNNCSASLLLAADGETVIQYGQNQRIYVNEINQWAFIYYVLSSIGTARPNPSPTPTPSPSPTPEPAEDETGATESESGVKEEPGSALPGENQEEVNVTPSPTPIPEIIRLSTVITVPQAALDAANRLEYHENIGLLAGDRISVETLIKMFILTQADDVRETLIWYVARSEANAVNGMNRVARQLKMTATHYANTTSLYNSNQYTSVADIYTLFKALRSQSIFNDLFTQTSTELSYKSRNKEQKVICKNSMYGDALLYGAIELPEGYTFRARISGACEKGGCAQIMLADGPDGKEYVAIVGAIPFEKDVAIEVKRFLELKTEYTDAKQELPLGDAEERYRYLLDAEANFYTMDNRPEAYTTMAKANRYMMSLTTKVWKLNENTGERYSATMTTYINRKLYQSLKEIMEEVYALPLKFPLKVFLGYGYRKSGGVGLSNCTLMSMHSYGGAVDLNNGDYDNDYFLGKGNDLRDKTNPYCIPDEVIAIFDAHGWYWGGNFEIASDTMHFQYLPLDYLTYQDNSPFITLTTSGDMQVGIIVANLQDRLAELGYNVNRNGVYNNSTRTALMKFQARNGLPVTGEVDYKTWETIINLTHYMSYVF